MTRAKGLPDFFIHANCSHSGPDIFFPGSGGNGALEAKAICAACKIRKQCGEYAISESIPAGIWGGMSARERRKIKNERKNNAVG